MGCRKSLHLQILLVLWLSVFVSTMSGSFGEAVRISQEPPSQHHPKAFFGGVNSIRLINDALHLSYMELNDDSRFEVVYSNYQFEDNEMQRVVLDDFFAEQYHPDNRGIVIEPVIEKTADGRLVILYSKLSSQEPVATIYRLLVDQFGEVIARDSLLSYTNNRGQMLADEEKINLLLKTGFYQPTDINYHLFTDIDRGGDDVPGRIVWWEGDILYGNVHSNSDIYLRNNSWPTFHGLVTTAGTVRVSPGGGTNYPQDEIFRGGLIENHPPIRFNQASADVRRNSILPLGAEERDDAIAYVTVDGSDYEIMLGEIITEDVTDPDFEWIEGVNQFTIYDSYPPYGPIGEETGTNRIPGKDTVWTLAAEGALVEGSSFIPMEMWISGDFSGRQTWASSHDIYLKDDLTYRNTTPGQSPDGYDSQGNQTLPVNQTDYLGIISEESILVQYGHYHPRDSVRFRPNTDDIYLYGAYCASGLGDNPWDDGLFTFQYQYPKGSTPPQSFQGEFYDKIDLHLYSYPTTAQSPWPPGLDYPWYNPLWPEPGEIWNVPGLPASTPNPHNVPEIVRERGDISFFGSIAQRRRGAAGVLAGGVVHRIWNIDGEINPNIRPTYGSVPPGRTGYSINYRHDRRFDDDSPPNMGNTGIFNSSDSNFKYLTSDDGIEFETILSGELEPLLESLVLAAWGNSAAILKGSSILLFTGNNDEYEEHQVDIPEEETVREMVYSNNALYLLTTNYLTDDGLYDSKIYRYSFAGNSLSLERQDQFPYLMQTIHDFNGNLLWAAAVDEQTIEIINCNAPDNEEPYRWTHDVPAPEHFPPAAWKEHSKIALQSDEEYLYIAVHYRLCIVPDMGGDIYVAKGRFEYNPATAQNPLPEDEAVNVSVDWQELSWDYIVDTLFVNPVGFRVYFNDTGEFNDDDKYAWVDYLEDRITYSTQEVLPDYFEYDKKYYWKVIPTTIHPNQQRTESRKQKSSYRQSSFTRGDALNCPVWTFRTEIDTAVEQDLQQMVTELKPSFPNPLNPNTTLNYTIGKDTRVELTIYNVRGQIVVKLVDEIQSKGEYSVKWNGKDDNGRELGSGVYFYRLKTDYYDQVKKMLLAK